MGVRVTLKVRIKGIKQLRENLPVLTPCLSAATLHENAPSSQSTKPRGFHMKHQADLRAGQPPCTNLFPTLHQLVVKNMQRGLTL